MQRRENKNFEMQYQVSLMHMESDIMRDQLKGLYEAVSNIGVGKKQADKKQFELDNAQKHINDVQFDKEKLDHEHQNVRDSMSSIRKDYLRERQAQTGRQRLVQDHEEEQRGQRKSH